MLDAIILALNAVSLVFTLVSGAVQPSAVPATPAPEPPPRLESSTGAPSSQ